MSDTSTIQQVSVAEKKATSITSEIALKLSQLGSDIKKDFTTVKSTIYSWAGDVQREVGKVDSLIVTDIKQVGDDIVADFEYLIDNVPVSVTINHNPIDNTNGIALDSANGGSVGPLSVDATDGVKLDVTDLLSDTDKPAPITASADLNVGALETKATLNLPTLLDSAKSHSFAIHASIDGTTWLDDPSVLSVSNGHPLLTINKVVEDGRTIDWTKVQKVRVIQYATTGVAILGIEYSVAIDASTPVQFGGEFNGAEASASPITIKFAFTVSASRLLSYDELDNGLILTSK